MTDIEKLRCFAQEIVACHTGALEGPDIEFIAIKYGLMEHFVVTGPCVEACPCTEFGFPAACCRRTALLTGVIEP